MEDTKMENSKKFEEFVKTFGINPKHLARASSVNGFKNFRSINGSYDVFGEGVESLFDHVELFKRDNGDVIFISQPYLTREDVLEAMTSSIPFIAHLKKFKYTVIVDDYHFNYHSNSCIAIIMVWNKFDLSNFKLSDSEIPVGYYDNDALIVNFKNQHYIGYNQVMIKLAASYNVHYQ